MNKSARFGKGAIGKVNQALPSTDANVTSVSNRVTVLEQQNLNSRIATLESLVASLQTHTHSYDDENGTTTTSKTTSTPT